MIEAIKKYLGLFLTATAVCGVLIGWATYIDARYAKASVVQQIDDRLTLSELHELLEEALLERKRLRKLIELDPDDQDAKDELEKVEDEIAYLKDRIRKLKK